MVNSNFASSSIGQPNIAWPRPSTGPQVFTGLDLIAKIWPESDSVYDLTAIDIRIPWSNDRSQGVPKTSTYFIISLI
jgi:hypothetical protein